MQFLKYILFFLLLTACKSQKTVLSTASIKTISTAKIVKKHNANTLTKNSVKARLKLTINNNNKQVDVTAKLRLVKDKNIWISITKAGFPFAKIYITPTRVQYYEKIHKIYFDGDFSLLNSWLGVGFYFQKIQNLLLGKALFPLHKKEVTSKIVETSYLLKPIIENDLFSILYHINSSHFYVNKELLTKAKGEESLSLSYDSYQEIENEIFPKQLTMIITKKENVTNVVATYKLVEFNKELTFPFTIPKGYKALELKK